MSHVEDSPLPLADVSSLPGYQWSHGIAIVLQLVDQLSPGGQEPAGTFPDVDRIALAPTGILLTQLEPRGREPLAGISRLLHQLVSQASPPPALRLVLMSASATRPLISFGELIRELGKWDRPDRLDLLVDLYRRARHPQSAPPPLPLAAPETQASAKRYAPEAVAFDEDETPVRASGRRSLVPQLVIATAAAVTVSVIATFLFYGPGASETLPLVGIQVAAASTGPLVLPHIPVPEAITYPAPPAEGRQVRAGTGNARVVNVVATEPVRAITPRTETAPVASPAAAAPPARQTIQSAPPSAALVGYSPAVMHQAEEQFRRARGLFEQKDYAAASAAFLQVVEVLEKGDPTLELRLIAAELAGASRALSSNASAEAARVYTSADAGVTQPVALAHLPQPVTASTPADQIGVLELLIDSRGHVESAHLVGADQHFRDRWLISAAKSWLFEPAKKDGQPVRFLKRHTFVLAGLTGPQ